MTTQNLHCTENIDCKKQDFNSCRDDNHDNNQNGNKCENNNGQSDCKNNDYYKPPCENNGGNNQHCEKPPICNDSGNNQHCEKPPICNDSGNNQHCEKPPICNDSGNNQHCDKPPTCNDSGNNQHCDKPPICNDGGNNQHCDKPPTCDNSGGNNHPICNPINLSCNIPGFDHGDKNCNNKGNDSCKPPADCHTLYTQNCIDDCSHNDKSGCSEKPVNLCALLNNLGCDNHGNDGGKDCNKGNNYSQGNNECSQGNNCNNSYLAACYNPFCHVADNITHCAEAACHHVHA